MVYFVAIYRYTSIHNCRHKILSILASHNYSLYTGVLMARILRGLASESLHTRVTKGNRTSIL